MTEGIRAELRSGLRALASTDVNQGPPDAAEQAQPNDPPAARLTRSSVPLPPLQRPTVGGARRQLSEAGLAVADRIMAAVAGPAVVIPMTNPAELSTAVESDTVAAAVEVAIQPISAVIVAASGTECVLADGAELVIGRGSGNGLTVNHREVSRRHVKIEFRLGRLLATDLGSVNGTTIVNTTSRHLVPGNATALSPGDRLLVGGEILLCTVLQVG